MPRWAYWCLLGATLVACDKLNTNREVEQYGTFGEVIYRESCQRVAYMGQLEQQAAGERTTVDVSGQYGRTVCVDGAAPPTDAPPKLSAIVQQKSALITLVDTLFPKGSDLLNQLEPFLEQLLPLSDDGTMQRAIASLGDTLGTMEKDPDFSPALARLALRNGYRPTKTAAGLVHTILDYPGFDLGPLKDPSDPKTKQPSFMQSVLDLLAPGGTAETEWKQLLLAGSWAMKTVQPVANTGDPDRTLRIALNLLTATHPDLATGRPRPLVTRDYRGLAVAAADGTGKVVAPFVDMNNDGLADTDKVGRYVDAKGAVIKVASPFPELGVADTAPRDALGRALTAENATTTLYRYLDLDGTVFGGLAREGLQLMDPKKDTTIGLLWGMGALLGPRATKTEMYMDPAGGMMGSLTYSGFDVSQSAVLDLVHAFAQLFGDPNADDTFQATATLLDQHESETARLVKAMLDTSDTGKKYPNAAIPAQSTLYDDLAVLIDRILAIPGLPEDLMDALENPAAKDLGPMIARQASLRNKVDFARTGPSYTVTQDDLDKFRDPVDRSKPDVDDNRSLLQRIAHVIHDSNGVTFCSKKGAVVKLAGIPIGTFDNECDLFRVPDLGLFYVTNMASQAARDENDNKGHKTANATANFCKQLVTTNIAITGACPLGIGVLVGIDGFGQYPTPASLNRSLLLRQNEKSSFLQDTTEDIICSDGDKFVDVHQSTLVAWESKMANSVTPNATFYTAVQPLVDAFVKHDECILKDPSGACTKYQNAGKIFVDILAMMHTHWTSPNGSYYGHKYQSTTPGAPRYSSPDNLTSYEPLLTDVLGKGDLLPALLAIAPTLNSMTVDGSSNGRSARDALIGSARYLMQFGGAPGLIYRNGAITTTRSDGVTPVKTITPYYLMADAFANKRAALDQVDKTRADAWRNATSAIVDQLLTVKQTGTSWQFSNRHFRAISLVMINFLRGRIAAHVKAGDLDQWVHHTLSDDLTEKLGGPTFAALADFVSKIEGDSEGRNQLYGLLQYLVNEAEHDLAFQTALTTLADQVQMFLDDPDLVPVAHVMGAALAPDTGAVDAQLTLLKRSHDLDTKSELRDILKALYLQKANGVYPASDLADILSELNRTRPGQGGDLTGDDYRRILGEAKAFLIDDQRGFTRFLNVVKSRGTHN